MSSIERSKAETETLTPEEFLAERRRMLRAAAAVPFIATIQSGAVLANASASQCVIDSKDASAGGVDVPLQTRNPQTPDKWVRRRGQLARASSNYYYNLDNSLPTRFVITKADTDAVWYTSWGQLVEIDIVFDSGNNTCNPDSQICVSAAQGTPTLLLEIYQPETVNGLPVSVHPVGYYARDDLQFYRSSAPADNMAMTASCLVSVDPGLDPNAGA